MSASRGGGASDGAPPCSHPLQPAHTRYTPTCKPACTSAHPSRHTRSHLSPSRFCWRGGGLSRLTHAVVRPGDRPPQRHTGVGGGRAAPRCAWQRPAREQWCGGSTWRWHLGWRGHGDERCTSQSSYSSAILMIGGYSFDFMQARQQQARSSGGAWPWASVMPRP